MHQEIMISKIGSCCSDFTVDYALLVKDKFYVAYYDENHHITVASRTFEEDDWVISHPQGEWLPEKQRFMHQTEYDSHNYLTLAMDNKGHIHLSGNMHKDKMVWFHSTKPYDIHSLIPKTMTGEREDSVTYPLFFYGNNGEFFFRYRDGESGNGDDIYNYWNEADSKWIRLQENPLLSGEGLRNAYARLPVAGPDNQWHMIWMWRDTPHCETCHDLSYARSPDLLKWYSHDGYRLPVPITLQKGDIVDASPVKRGLINMSQNIGFDAKCRPLITWHRYDNNGFSQAWIARPEGNKWRINQISNWKFRWDFSGMGSIPPDVIISAPYLKDTDICVDFKLSSGKSGTWLLNQETLKVIRTDACSVSPLPEDFYIPCEELDPEAKVQIIPELYTSSPKYFLRWEALPIQRDISSGKTIRPSMLTLVCSGLSSGKEGD
ncbi:hypothetical protein CHU32_17305 [Superficieibacter electus]|uniref:Uncharacterized protein n=1 Tax=Superficieibacter electus TaxID=2022662 RepID=A0A2P5GLR4_9ENTR|nr:BNR repeat-containing protein [Superficieibacter electus]POP42985.1 hypothetical protein CHU33_17205 [Superficieibacter electus]POP46480.1 hypothetical protein CHU32_17305 [Superficieibacter electus]